MTDLELNEARIKALEAELNAANKLNETLKRDLRSTRELLNGCRNDLHCKSVAYTAMVTNLGNAQDELRMMKLRNLALEHENAQLKNKVKVLMS